LASAGSEADCDPVFAELDETIRQLLIRHVPLDLAEVDVSFDAPDREWSGRLSRPTVNCFLYDVHQNLQRRDTEWQVTRDDVTRAVTRKKGPLRIDATYYVTVWARAPEDEHRLLWRVMAALARFPAIPTDVLASGLQDQPFPIQTQLAQGDQTRTSATDLWQALDNRVRPSLSYVVTLALDTSFEFTSPMVFTRVARINSAVNGVGGADELVYSVRPAASADAASPGSGGTTTADKPAQRSPRSSSKR
jgi:hypothetical protein